MDQNLLISMNIQFYHNISGIRNPKEQTRRVYHGWSCPSVATRAASKDLRTVSLVSTSVRVQLHGLRTRGGSDVDAHAVNTWKSVVAFGYVWIRILSVFFFALKRLEYQDLDHMMPSLGLMPRGKGPGDPSEPPTTGFTGHMVEQDHFCQIP